MPIITLMTDFGVSSPYVAEMKGVILSICATANIVDLTHAVPAQDVMAGAFLWKQATMTFPPGAIHVAVVDPGVGSERPIVAARRSGSIFIAPDNGLLGLIVESVPPDLIIELDDPAFWRDTVSATFHGRDIMAPVAAHLSQGVAMEELGSPCPDVKPISLPRVVASSNSCTAVVLWIDGFGNVITNIRKSDLPPEFVDDSFSFRCGNVLVGRVVSHYAAAPAGELVALIGSAGMLELSVVGGSAGERLKASQGDSLELSWQT
jgi:S-adenosylmethionine hydrolase